MPSELEHPGDLGIRPATAADIAAVLQLLERSGLPQVGVQENLEAFVVAGRGAEVVGCAGVERHAGDGLLRSVTVDESHRGRRLGEALVQHLVRRSQQQGLTHLYLLTTTAAHYFARLGFEPCARDDAPNGIRSSWEFRSGCPTTAACMRRAIDAGGTVSRHARARG